MVFDDWFSTVSTSEAELPDFRSDAWNKLLGYYEDDEFHNTLGEDDEADVEAELSNADNTAARRYATRQDAIARAMGTAPLSIPVPPPAPAPVPVPSTPTTRVDAVSSVSVPPPAAASAPTDGPTEKKERDQR